MDPDTQLRASAIDTDKLSAILAKQRALNEVISAMGLTEVHNVRPILDGKAICALYEIRPGKMIKPLLDELLSFQILHPEATKEDAETYLSGKKSELLAKHGDAK